MARRHQSFSLHHAPSQLGQSGDTQSDAYDVPRGVQFLEVPTETSERQIRRKETVSTMSLCTTQQMPKALGTW